MRKLEGETKTKDYFFLDFSLIKYVKCCSGCQTVCVCAFVCKISYFFNNNSFANSTNFKILKI